MPSNKVEPAPNVPPLPVLPIPTPSNDNDSSAGLIAALLAGTAGGFFYWRHRKNRRVNTEQTTLEKDIEK